MITRELLNNFCYVGTNVLRAAIRQPWTRGYTYATEGRIVVRVPALPDVPDCADAPDAIHLQWDLFDGAQFVALPEIPEPLIMPCGDCAGIGAFNPQTGNPQKGGEPCEECDGKGAWEKSIAVQSGERQISNIYLRKIATLPNPRIAVNGRSIDVCPFVFDGGDGLVMPMRTL